MNGDSSWVIRDAGFALVYVGDYCSLRYQIPRGSPAVRADYGRHSLRHPSKERKKTEYELGGTGDEPCVHSLFPHSVAVPVGMPVATPRDAWIFDLRDLIARHCSYTLVTGDKRSRPQNSRSHEFGRIARIRAQASQRYDQSRAWLVRLPVQAPVILGAFFWSLPSSWRCTPPRRQKMRACT